GVIVHEVPEGISMIAILLYYGWHRGKVIQLSSFVALATQGAAILTFTLVKNLSQSVLGTLLATAGGSFVCIAAPDLIQESHRSRGFSATGPRWLHSARLNSRFLAH
ncbi:MAG: hypothetical protein EP304_07030, partial [Deltaproteobacteria bacterium]